MTHPYDLAHLLPHRPPFRLVDRICAFDLDNGQLRAERHVSADDPLLLPLATTPGGILPSTLVIEALAQTCACLNGLGLMATNQNAPAAPHRGYLVAATDFQFPDSARPGDTLVLEVTRQAQLGTMHAFSARAHVSGRDIAVGRLLFAVAEA